MLKFRSLEDKSCILCAKPVFTPGNSHRLYCDTCQHFMELEHKRQSYHRNKQITGDPSGPKPKPLPPIVSSTPLERCNRGHEYTPENTGLQRGGKYCKACKLLRERELHDRRRRANMQAPTLEVTDFWPYGASDPLALSIERLLPQDIPEDVRADAGQQAWLEITESGRRRVNEANLKATIKRALRDSYGDWAVSIDYRREDGFSIADRLEAPDIYV